VDESAPSGGGLTFFTNTFMIMKMIGQGFCFNRTNLLIKDNIMTDMIDKLMDVLVIMAGPIISILIFIGVVIK
jgi:hypothetical protein